MTELASSTSGDGSVVVNVAVMGPVPHRDRVGGLLESPKTQVRLLDCWPTGTDTDLEWADVIFVLSRANSCNRIYLGDGALLASVRGDQLVVDVGNVAAAALKAVVCEAQSRGTRFVDVRRVATDLTCWGGMTDAWAGHAHLLNAFGDSILHCGDGGSAAVASDVVSHVTLVSCAGSQEGLVLGARAGVNVQALTNVIQLSSGESSSLISSVPKVDIGEAGATRRRSGAAASDLADALCLAGALHVPAPLGALALALVHGASHGSSTTDVAEDLRAFGASLAGLEPTALATDNIRPPRDTQVSAPRDARLPKVGFIGLGRIGTPMASTLLRMGYELEVHNRSQTSVEQLVKRGARARANPLQIVQHCEVVITCLPDDDAFSRVYWGPDGLLRGIRHGQELIDTGTTSVDVTMRVGTEVADRGAIFVDAPVSGGLEKAASGELTVMVGSPEDALSTGSSVLSSLGTDVFYMGQLGHGQVTKLVNNLLNATNFAATCEGLVLATAGGVGAGTMLAILNHPEIASYASAFRGPRILQDDYAATYTTSLRIKDSRAALELAHGWRVPLLLGSVVHQLFEAAAALGWGDEDWTSLAKVYETLAGVKLSALQGSEQWNLTVRSKP